MGTGRRQRNDRWTARFAAGGFLFAGIGLVVATSGCATDEQPETGQVQIDGSDAVCTISRVVAEEFTGEHPLVRVTVGVSRRSGGFRKLLYGELDMFGSAGEIDESEKRALADAGVEYLRLEVAYEGLAIVVNQGNDWVDCLTADQLKEVWQSKSRIKKWSDLNPDWPLEEIHFFGPETDSTTLDFFSETLFDAGEVCRADCTTDGDAKVLARGISEDKYAIGCFRYSDYDENKAKLRLVGVDNGEGCVKPSPQAISSGKYVPLSRPLFILVVRSSLRRREVRLFADFYVEHAAEAAVEVGSIPISEEVAAQNQSAMGALSVSESAGDHEGD